ncbi:MAG: outer membrane protein assembly factor BamA [Gammaproteobacteria bacterium]|nr:outer membrane protein assembly factor BamA [Gammaproteobacteria bacterium]
MNYIKKGLLIAGVMLGVSQSAYAFTVKSIRFEGLQRVSQATALSYLPVAVGQDLTAQRSNTALQVLYKTGFFTNVTLYQDGDALVVKVVERPVISEVNVDGNDEIPDDKLKDALKNLGLVQGQVFQQSILQEVKQALADQYYSSGYYNAKVTAKVTPQPRNRVSVNIEVSEGRIAKVEGIRVVGSQHFSESDLVSQFTLKTPSILTFFNGKDKYSEQALQSSIDALKSFYMDRGYIKISVDSQQVTITPDRKYVYVVVGVTEGDQYSFGDYQLAGDLILPKATLQQYVKVQPGATFSRQKVLDTSAAISGALQDEGYAYAKVEAVPTIDEKNKRVGLTFQVTPGTRYYVRRVNFDGNSVTTDTALRNYMLQMDSSQYSKSHIETSLRNLRQLPYLDDQNLSYGLQRVDGTNNQVDLDMKVKEALSAQFQFNIGYSQAEKFMIGTSVTQQNFLGTGKTVGVSLQGSSYSKLYSLNYTNPFFTPEGVSHSMSAYIQKVNADAVDIADFSTSSYGINDGYGFPLSNYDNVNLGYGFKNTHLLLGQPIAPEMQSFVDQYGSLYHQLLLSAGWSHNTTDRYKLPTAGGVQDVGVTVSAPIDSKKLEYYTVSYDNHYYFPLDRGHNWIFTAMSTLGYGNGYGEFNQLPFFQNFYAGGLATQGQVRGYDANTLGPRDSMGNTIGGNELITGSIGLIIPNPGQNYGVRTTWFVDTGNVYSSQAGGVQLGLLRYSTGLQVEWWTPLGIPLVFSFAKAIHKQPGDVSDTFQFSMGGSF